MNAIRSYLFVPGKRLDLMDKAFASGADAVVVDWEDALAAEDKTQARADLQAWASARQQPFWLRLNAAASPEYAADVAAAAQLPCLQGVLLPKAAAAADVEALHQALQLPVVAVIETAQAMLAVAQIARVRGLAALTFGCLDLAHDLGMRADSAAAQLIFDRLRTDLLLHSRANGLAAPIDTVFADFRDMEGLARVAARGRDLGFGGMLCIHPAQVAAVHDAHRPSEAELAFARKVCAHVQQHSEAVFQIDGKMVDKPVILRAQADLQHYDAV